MFDGGQSSEEVRSRELSPVSQVSQGLSVKSVSAISGTSPSSIRKDRKGNIIGRGQNSQHKLTFADQIVDKSALVEVHEVSDLWGDRDSKSCHNCCIS
mmetsp:Transcript_80700/g.145672  ORF Transcript_80700/g.145672 Transcript_80700/m.145672 type:complete len:98 (+) Transcript_80700:90-383(+)